MKTKQLLRAVLITFLFALCMPLVTLSNDHKTLPAHRQLQMERLEQRLEDIRATDFKQLTREERRALRGEVKKIKKEMKALSGGVYISIGALILIALLLILLA